MKRRLFNKLMKRSISEIKDFYSVIYDRPGIIKRMINFCYDKDPHNSRGHTNLIIAMEELKEELALENPSDFIESMVKKINYKDYLIKEE